MPRVLRFLSFFILFIPALVLAAPPDTLPEGGRGGVATVVDGDTLRLLGGDADVRLVGIQAPKLPLGRAGFKAWPLSDRSQKTLDDMVKGHSVVLRLGATPRDRNGRILAHIVRDDGLWIQAEMLRQGMARVYTFADNRQLAPELYAAEREARTAKRGIWADAFYAVRSVDPDVLAKDAGTFQLVTGKVANTAKVRGRVYINFGADYRTDFTVAIAPEALPQFTKSGLDPLSLKDKTIRVRGYLRNYNGPLIELTYPEQLELDP